MSRALSLIALAALVLGLSVPVLAQSAGTRVLEIKAVDDKDRPLAGVAVKLSAYVNNKQVQDSKQTDDGGMATLVIGPTAPAEYINVSASKAGFTPKRLTWRKNGGVKDDAPASYTLKMEPATKLSGQVVDDADKPVGGATVVMSIRNSQRDAVENYDVSYKTIKCDGEGKWSFTGAPAKLDKVALGAWHHDCDITQGYFGVSDFTDIDGLRNGTAKIKIDRGKQVEGIVYGSDGSPIKADVGIGGDRVASNVIPPIKTDASGRFHFGAKPGSQVVITVKAPKHGPELVEFVMPDEPKHIDFHLQAGKTLEGNIVDATGKGIAGVSLYTDTWRGHRTLDTRMTTDKSGHFSWNAAPSDDVLMDIFKAGYGDLRNKPLKPSTQPVTLTLRSPLHVTGEVTDAESGKPVENFRVVKGIVFENSGKRISWQRDNSRASARPGGKFEFNETYPYPGYVVRIEAEGYLPADSRVYKTEEGNVALQLKLKKGEGLTGNVVSADGKPVEGADVILATRGMQARLQNGALPEYERDAVRAKTDANGKFSLPPQGENDKFLLIAIHDSGQAQTDSDQLAAAKGRIVLAAWGKVEGTVKIGSKPGANETIMMSMMEQYTQDAPHIFKQYQTKADAQGHYAFDRVFAGKYSAYRQIEIAPRMWSGVSSTRLEAKAGETAKIDIGGRGRPVVGRITGIEQLPAGWIAREARISTKREAIKPPYPDDYAAMDLEHKKEWYQQFLKSDEGKAYKAKMEEISESSRYYSFTVKADGTFRADDVEPGSYNLNIMVSKPNARDSFMGDPIGSASKEFEVGTIAGGQSDEPLDVGSLEIKAQKNAAVGEKAPEFVTKTLDGKELKLTDFKGKYVLLDFWATWCGPCVEEMPSLKAAYDAFGSNPKFAMLSLSLDDDVKAPIAFVAKNEIKWQQAFLGEWSKDKVTPEYGIRGIPSVWLIDPQGVIVAKGLRGESVKAELARVLGK